MRHDDTPEARAFNHERSELFRRYERLIRVLSEYRALGSPPPSTVQRLPNWFDGLFQPNPRLYPRPRELTESETVEVARRTAIAQTVSYKAFQRAREHAAHGNSASATRLRRVGVAMLQWPSEIERLANARQQLRHSKRIAVRRYLRDVEAFCVRWHLLAPWAVPAVLDHHMKKARLGIDAFLPSWSDGLWPGDDIPIVVMVPGANTELFERQRDRFLTATFEAMIADAHTGSEIHAKWKPDQAEQWDIERQHGSSCVVIRWDGFTDGAFVRSSAVSECERRVHRRLTKAERRRIASEIDPQMREARAELERRGWSVQSAADVKQHARWIAKRLLTGASWHELADFTHDETGAGVEASSIARACRKFAHGAQLHITWK